MRLALIAAAVGLLVACSGGSQCNATSCPGCCDAKGACQEGAQVSACGAIGVACATCGVNELCGSAQRVCGPCGPATCSGCCTSDGRCTVEIRDRDINCGIDGVACVDCTATGKTCNATTVTCQ